MGLKAKLVALATGGALALALAPAASGASGGGACTVSATATFSQPLSLTSGPFAYTLGGELSNCNAGNTQSGSDGPGTGALTTPDPATGTGSCASRESAGTAVIAWSDGHSTVISFDVPGYGPIDHLTGYVVHSYTHTAAGGTSTTYTTDEPATPVNDSVEAVLAASPGGGPTACQTGVRTASLTGPVGFGSPY